MSVIPCGSLKPSELSQLDFEQEAFCWVSTLALSWNYKIDNGTIIEASGTTTKPNATANRATEPRIIQFMMSKPRFRTIFQSFKKDPYLVPTVCVPKDYNIRSYEACFKFMKREYPRIYDTVWSEMRCNDERMRERGYYDYCEGIRRNEFCIWLAKRGGKEVQPLAKLNK